MFIKIISIVAFFAVVSLPSVAVGQTIGQKPASDTGISNNRVMKPDGTTTETVPQGVYRNSPQAGGIFDLRSLDANKDGVVGPDEYRASGNTVSFAELDLNGDGIVDPAELDAYRRNR